MISAEFLSHLMIKKRMSMEEHLSLPRAALLPEVIDETVVIAVCYVVEVLRADDLGNFLGLRQLLGSDIAHTEMTN
jgi:hypothetical protein